MAEERKAAIDLDAIQDKPLDSLTAADFLNALGRTGTVGVQAMRFWPEKKKYELYVEPENLGRITMGGLIRGLREKKKVELEKEPRTEIVHKAPGSEFEWLDPRDLVINPAFRDAVTNIVQEVVGQMGRGR
jgi:hypothetical protein